MHWLKDFFASVECSDRILDPFERILVVADPSRGNGALCLAITPKMKAMGIKNLIDKYGMTQEEVAKQIGKSRSAICNTLRVLNLDPRVLEFVKQGKLV